MDVTRSRLCFNGQWTSDPWTIAKQDPTVLTLAVGVLVLFLQVCVMLFGTSVHVPHLDMCTMHNLAIFL
jgi:hypothetical protein